MELTITPEVEALLERQMRSGRFQSENEVIETALHALSEGSLDGRLPLDSFIQEGLDSADRGELYSEDEARAYLAAVRAKL